MDTYSPRLNPDVVLTSQQQADGEQLAQQSEPLAKKRRSGRRAVDQSDAGSPLPPAGLQAECTASTSGRHAMPLPSAKPLLTGQQALPVNLVGYWETIGRFIPEHRNQVLDSLESGHSLEILEAATRLLETCKRKRIVVKPTLLTMLSSCHIDDNHQLFILFLEKAIIFFEAVGSDIKNASILTKMIYQRAKHNAKFIADYVQYGNEDIQAVASSPALNSISAICTGRGFPDLAKVKALLGWLPEENYNMCLEIASRALNHAGLPEITSLNSMTSQLQEIFSETKGLSDINPTDLKCIALFCSAARKRNLGIGDLKSYLDANSISPASSLKPLLAILTQHGGDGVRCFLDIYRQHPQEQKNTAAMLSFPASLSLVRYAVSEIPASQWPDYVSLCRNLSPEPGRDQWSMLDPFRSKLEGQPLTPQPYRKLLEILWSFDEPERRHYCERINDILAVVPLAHALCKLARQFRKKKFQTFLNACLEYRLATDMDKMSKASLEVLLGGLLNVKLPLPNHKATPGNCFAVRSTSENGKGSLIKCRAPVRSGIGLLGHFVAVLLDGLHKLEYRLNGQHLVLKPVGSIPMLVPKPTFEVAHDGIIIKNWTTQQLDGFLNATEFTKECRQPPHDRREHSASPGKVVLKKMAGNAPEVLSEQLKTIYQETPQHVLMSMPSSSTTPSPPPLSAPFSILENPGVAFARLWAQVKSISLLEELDLEILEDHRQHMNIEQLTEITRKISTKVDGKKIMEWYKTLEEKRLTNEPNPADLNFYNEIDEMLSHNDSVTDQFVSS